MRQIAQIFTEIFEKKVPEHFGPKMTISRREKFSQNAQKTRFLNEIFAKKFDAKHSLKLIRKTRGSASDLL